jgi:dTMP kinase
MTEDSRPGRGLFITFEGIEGCGKTTQMGILVARLREQGYPVTVNQEPGGTLIGKAIRQILLDPANVEMTPKTELLLMFASRAQAAAEVILPALNRGDIVISDRFTDSSLAYQGAARGLGFEMVLELHKITLGSLMPDLTICPDIEVGMGLARAHGRNECDRLRLGETRIDHQCFDFHCRVRDAYHRIAQAEPQRFRLVNGNGTPSEVFERIWGEIEPLLCRVTK